MDKPPRQTSKLSIDLERMATDPFHFDELVETWNAVFDEEQLDRTTPASEERFDKALSALSAQDGNAVVGARLRQIIAALPHAALVVRQDGRIQATNNLALGRLICDPGQHVDDLGLSLVGAERLQAAIARLLDRRNAPTGSVELFRAVEDKTEKHLTIAVVPSQVIEGEPAQAMLFVIEPAWRQEVEGIIARAFQLTEAECDVLLGFMDGHTLKEIALERSRSLATVRTQFQRILEKTDSNSQAELMRNTLAISQFFQDVEEAADTASHPRRKRFDLLRQGGRSVDVTLCGDMSGRLIVNISSTTLWTFHAHLEEAFYEAGLCVASLCRPGYGRTDPPPEGMDYDACLAEDVTALLTQTGAERCVIWGHNTSSPFAFRTASLLPETTSALIVHAIVAPLPYIESHRYRTPWASAIARALRGSPTVYHLIVRAGIKAWQAMGTRRIFALQFRNNPDDVALATSAESVAELDASIRQVMAQGLEYTTIAFDYAARDWSDWIRNCAVPIHLIQGSKDGTSPIEVAENLAQDFSEQITLHTLEGAGFMSMLSHSDAFVDLLKQISTNPMTGSENPT
ncbi:MAG: alpha/beta fold hydrolase [Pseudomonadota bacterium]